MFEVDDLAFDLDLQGDMDDGFELGGEVRLVSGRYLQDFKMQNLVISPRVNESSVRPFYDGKPLLENLALDLSVRTVGEGFVVQNNLAPEIHVDILLHVGGTLSRPSWRATSARPTAASTSRSCAATSIWCPTSTTSRSSPPSRSRTARRPSCDLEATNLVTDANGNDHNVRMRIRGPMREAQIDLSSDDGLDRNQTAMLLLTGRTADRLAAALDPEPDRRRQRRTGADVGGQITRDTVANLMEPYIDDTFYRLTGLNLRLTVGSDGFQGRVRKRISRLLNFQADYLQGFQNNSRWTAQVDVWLRRLLSSGGGSSRSGRPRSRASPRRCRSTASRVPAGLRDKKVNPTSPVTVTPSVAP